MRKLAASSTVIFVGLPLSPPDAVRVVSVALRQWKRSTRPSQWASSAGVEASSGRPPHRCCVLAARGNFNQTGVMLAASSLRFRRISTTFQAGHFAAHDPIVDLPLTITPEGPTVSSIFQVHYQSIWATFEAQTESKARHPADSARGRETRAILF